MNRGDDNSGLGRAKFRHRDDGESGGGLGPIRFRVFAVLTRNGDGPELVEIGAARDAESAFEFAWLVRPGTDPRIVGVRIVENGGRVWTLGERDAASPLEAVVPAGRIRAKGDRLTGPRGERKPEPRLSRNRQGRIDWGSFGRDDH